MLSDDQLIEAFTNICDFTVHHNRVVGTFNHCAVMGRVSHTVPIFEYAWEERLQFEQAAHPRTGKHVPYPSEGEATWGVLRRGCDAPVGWTYRDGISCTCARCKLVFWNIKIPEHFYKYTPELDVQESVQPRVHKRALEKDYCESGSEDTEIEGRRLQDEIMGIHA